MNIESSIIELGKKAKAASLEMKLCNTNQKNKALSKLTENLDKNRNGILNSNKIDLENAKKAINAGKEVIVHMPMQSAITSSGEDEFKLKIGMTSEEIEWRLNEALNEIPEAVGINNHQGSKATTDGKVMAVVASVLKNKNKFFLDSRTSSKTVGENTMRSVGVPTARRHIFLDNDLSIENISKQLNKLVTVAEKKGLAIGIGHVKGNTLKVLEEEIPALVEQGFEFKFLSQVVD